MHYFRKQLRVAVVRPTMAAAYCTIAFGGLIAGVGAAWAHATLDHASPPAGSTVHSADRASDNQTNQRAVLARRMRPIKPAPICKITPIIHQDAIMYSKLRCRIWSNTKA